MDDAAKQAVAVENGLKDADELVKKVDEILLLPETSSRPFYGTEYGAVATNIDTAKNIGNVPNLERAKRELKAAEETVLGAAYKRYGNKNKAAVRHNDEQCFPRPRN